MRWQSDHWSIPLLMIAIVWAPIVIGYQTGWVSDTLHRLDDALGDENPRELSPAAEYATLQLTLGHCDFGAFLLDWVGRGPNPPPLWTQSDVLACLDGAGRGAEALDRLRAHCAALPPIENEVVPAFRANPLYPPSARMAGTEGQIIVSFDIAEDGSVRGLEIEASEPPGVFDEAAILAVERWRYCPGPGFEDVQVRLTFEFEDEEASDS